MERKKKAIFSVSLMAVLACGTWAGVHAASPPVSKADTELTQRIRRSLTEDKAVAGYAKDVKISALNGKVTLNGVVRSEIEKQQLGQKAASVAGPDNVVNGLEIAPAR